MGQENIREEPQSTAISIVGVMDAAEGGRLALL
jgi:hypothetical protein